MSNAKPNVTVNAGESIFSSFGWPAWLPRDGWLIGGVVLFLTMAILALAASWISSFDPLAQDVVVRLESSTAAHWLGTDTYGRDVLSRVLYGARISLFIGVLSVGAALVIGGALGIAIGYFGGWFERIVLAIIEVLMSFPTLLLGIIIVAMLGQSLSNLVIAIMLTAIAPFALIARSSAARLRNLEFVTACRALGYQHLRTMFVHILPNVIGEIMVTATLWVATAIRTEAVLSFVGLGVKPPTPTWGGMIREGFDNIFEAPWLVVYPSLAIFFVVFSLNLIGESLTKISDPRLAHV
jgi:peptide/nickel transport system permease protein